MLKAIIAPSLLASDLSKLGDECEELLKILKKEDYLHLDIMDSHFVPNMTFGPPVIKCLRKQIKTGFFDVHLMIENPKKWVKSYYEAGADLITIHVEACKNEKEVIETLELINSFGIKSCVSVKPKTKISNFILSLIEKKLISMILIMTVEPGFGGQKFMKNMMEKVKSVREKFPNFNIQVDGGIGLETIEIAAKSGANVVVAGTSIFKSKNKKDTIEKYREIINKYIK